MFSEMGSRQNIHRNLSTGYEASVKTVLQPYLLFLNINFSRLVKGKGREGSKLNFLSLETSL